jgi:hypothetical protein
MCESLQTARDLRALRKWKENDATAEPVLEGQTFQTAREPLGWACELSAKNLKLMEKPDRVHSGASEAHFRLLPTAI